MIIAVDFDGTIVRSNYPVILGEQPYAGEALRKLHAQGHYIIIWTCRCGDQLLKAINWLLEHQIPFDRINDHNPENVAKYGEGGNKVYAHCYIDDKNLFGFPGWPACMAEIERMEAEYQSSIPDSHATSTG
ncbi:MAG: hypothetical protein HP046_19555 [Parabacteroides sp.]|nr:hypothetical protein [Parabacteroides sp.]